MENKYASELNTKNPKILSAFSLALENHNNQFRKSGEPYIEHCIEVYKILRKWGIIDQDLLIAALLHDVVEDSSVKIETIITMFGNGVAGLVESVTKLQFEDKEKQDFNALKRVIAGSFLDPKVSVLKLADRYHNLNTLQYLPGEKRERKAKESLEVYAKLAESLGLWVIKTEIEDLSFQYLYFDRFSKVKASVDQDERLSDKETLKITKQIESALKKSRVKAKVYLKKSGYYHAYQKLKQYSLKGISSNDNYKTINDVVSYRVVVPSTEECYRALYLIHKEFGNQVDYSRFDEFVEANKRINGYEALQTTINTEHGSIEIAIVTENMENFNNWGYVHNLTNNIKTADYNLKLIFTPALDVIILPEKARAIDFAYAVNPKLGDNSTAVEVDGSTKPLDWVVTNTDVVKVVTGERSTEQDEYLANICLPQTRPYIQKKLIDTEKATYTKLGKNILENHLAPRGILDLRDINQSISKISYELGCESAEEIYYGASKGYLNIEKLDNLLNEYNITKNKLGWTTVQVRGLDKPGILKLISDHITKHNGNIVRITFQKDNEDGLFYLRIVAENINLKNTEKLRQELESEAVFKDIRIC